MTGSLAERQARIVLFGDLGVMNRKYMCGLLHSTLALYSGIYHRLLPHVRDPMDCP